MIRSQLRNKSSQVLITFIHFIQFLYIGWVLSAEFSCRCLLKVGEWVIKIISTTRCGMYENLFSIKMWVFENKIYKNTELVYDNVRLKACLCGGAGGVLGKILISQIFLPAPLYHLWTITLPLTPLAGLFLHPILPKATEKLMVINLKTAELWLCRMRRRVMTVAQRKVPPKPQFLNCWHIKTKTLLLHF